TGFAPVKRWERLARHAIEHAPIRLVPRPATRQLSLLPNPAGFPGSGTVCEDGDGRKVSCTKRGAVATDLVLYRPRLPDGTRPRIYLSADDPLVIGGQMIACRLSELRHGPPPAILRQPLPRQVGGELPGLEGAAAPVFVPDPSGCPAVQGARYRLVEADDLVPSHKADTFAPDPRYPEGVQERQYHRDKSEQLKVIQQAQCFQPSMLVNTNPDAVNGPPLVTDAGLVLGGNSRTMTVQRIYAMDPTQADRYRAELRLRARQFGLYPDNVDQFERPVLVRVVDVPDASPERLRVLVRLYNEAFTQSLDPTAMQVAVSSKIDASVIEALAGSMDPEDTFNAYLAGRASRPFLSALQTAGVLDRRNWSAYVSADTGLLNEDGRKFVARVLVGRVLPDPTVLDQLGSSLREALAGAVPAILSAAANGAKWDVVADLLPAAKIRVSMRAQGFDKLDDFIAQAGIFAADDVDLTPMQRVLVEILLHRAGKLQMQRGFRKFAVIAAEHPEGQASLSFIPPPSAIDALRASFDL
ncbi:MAG: hypothetical protein IIA54_08125, partial [Chloroflexi bacterium]|nr:hypothetical protein [Chloroflexota bacterium]